MNSLSWFIYLIQVLPSIKDTSIAFAIGSFVLFVGSWIVRAIIYDSAYSDDAKKRYDEKFKPSVQKVQRWFVGIFIVAMCAQLLLPNHRTMILIAASEVGERVVTHERVTSIVDPSLELLQTWIKKELADVKAAAEKVAETAKEKIQEKK